MYLNKLTIKDLDLVGKRVLIRVDFNVPMKNSVILDNQRILKSIPTIQYALENGAKSVILISHMSRPKGIRNKQFTLKPVAGELEKLLGQEVTFVDNCVGPEVEEICSVAEKGSVILLENLRFHPEEEGKLKDPTGSKVKKFRASLRRLGDVYVNDAFAAAHRRHSSLLGEGFEKRAAGLLLKKELEVISKALDNPRRPFLAILGGGKVKDKIPCIDKLLDQVDELIICGGIALTFLKVIKNMEIGNSIYDKEGAKDVERLMEKASEKGVTVHLPVDFITADRWGDAAQVGTADVETGVPKGWIALDIGLRTRSLLREPILRAKLIFWNGPPGVIIFDKFSQGIKAVMDAVVEATQNGTTTIIGGGDTGASAVKWGTQDKVSHVSTGGGVNLELLQGKILPAAEALSDA